MFFVVKRSQAMLALTAAVALTAGAIGLLSLIHI